MDPPPTTTTVNHRRRRGEVIVIIMGATGTGKSRLSIDLVTRYFHNAEIISSDKMQVYKGLNHTTNKITSQEQMGVPHHLLGAIDPTRPVFTPSDFRSVGYDIIKDVKSRRKIPIIVGGSNSFIYSLLAKRFDPDKDVFNGPDPDPVCSELRYDVCFTWVDVCLPVLNNYLSKRVDGMLECGMFDELSPFFGSGEYKKVNRSGLGVPEFEGYFSKFVETERAKFSISISRREIEEDFSVMSGRRLPRKPKKLPRYIQKQLDTLFPGLWLSEITADLYRVPDDV